MSEKNLNSAQVAELLAKRLDESGQEYAVGGAIALGFWSEPRGTVDVDLTLFLPPENPYLCIECLRNLGCDVFPPETADTLREHGFCRVQCSGVRVDVFLPISSFYEFAKERRATVRLGEQTVRIWDAESITVFKMMFFRRKDIADIEQLLRIQTDLDRSWVRDRILEIYGRFDPRLSQWDELVNEIP